jgi:radical SAM protein with 4Fe4S-binding SPASM domain
MCPRTTIMSRPVQHLDLSTFQKVLDSIELPMKGLVRRRPAKIPMTWLHMFGEALLNKDYAEIIDAAAEKFATVGVSTNGSMLTSRHIEALLRSKLGKLVISLDSVDSETYEEVRAGAPPLDVVLTRVKALLRRKAEINPALRCEIQVIEFPKHPGNTRAFVKHFSELGFSTDKNTVLLIKGLVDFASQVEVDGGIKTLNTGRRRPCHFPFRRSAIQSNGDVVACCLDVNGVLRMGNVFEESFHSIWTSDRYEKLRSAHRRLAFSEYDLCGGCDQTYEGVDQLRNQYIRLPSQR